MFKIETSKFYSEIMESVVKYFGMDAEGTTEAEVHQKIVEAETLTAMEARLTAAANESVKATMADLQSQLTALSGKVTAMEAAAATATDELKTANEKVTAMEVAAATANSQLDAANTKVIQLAGEVATLKAGKPAGGGEGADNGLELGEGGTKFGTVIPSTDLAAKLGITRK